MINNHKPTEQETKLYNALIERGIKATANYNDGHKTVDIAVLNAKLYIEIDGIQHFTDSEQIKRDFKRYHFSDGDDYATFYVTNQIVDTHLEDIADALQKVIMERISNKGVL